jgi:cold shock CspA family protein
MPTGTVKWFNYQTGFGLSSLRRGNDVFVHISAVEPGGFPVLPRPEGRIRNKSDKMRGKVSAGNLSLA